MQHTHTHTHTHTTHHTQPKHKRETTDTGQASQKPRTVGSFEIIRLIISCARSKHAPKITSLVPVATPNLRFMPSRRRLSVIGALVIASRLSKPAITTCFTGPWDHWKLLYFLRLLASPSYV